MTESRPPFPPFTLETAIQKVRIAEDSWNTCNSEKVFLGYAPGSRWRNRSEFMVGRPAIAAFLHRKWLRELDYRLIKSFGAFTGSRIAVRFAYEWHDVRPFAVGEEPDLQPLTATSPGSGRSKGLGSSRLGHVAADIDTNAWFRTEGQCFLAEPDSLREIVASSIGGGLDGSRGPKAKRLEKETLRHPSYKALMEQGGESLAPLAVFEIALEIAE